MKEKNTTILFYGATWGLVEATLGYLMHLFLVPFTGFVMFPIGVYFMRRGAMATDDKRAPVYISMIAASIKLVDLLLPNTVVIKAVNPAIAILLQGVVVSIFLIVKESDLLRKGILASLAWRLGFIGIVYLESLSGTQMRLLSSGAMGILRYLTVDALVNGLLIYGIVKGVKVSTVTLRPSYAVLALVAAVSINIAV